MSDEDVYQKALSAVRHDARNLLAGVAAMGRRFEETGDEKALKFAQLIEERLEAMVRLTQRADILAGIGEANVEEVRAEDLLVAAAEPIEGSGATIEREVADETLRCDRALTTLALSEILHNAVLSQGHVKVAVTAGVITVTDTGNGLPPFALETLLTPFRGAKRQGGSSLGMPIADRAMKVQGGAVTFEKPEEGAGATVRLILPA